MVLSCGRVCLITVVHCEMCRIKFVFSSSILFPGLKSIDPLLVVGGFALWSIDLRLFFLVSEFLGLLK